MTPRGLDPAPSDAELMRRYEEQQAAKGVVLLAPAPALPRRRHTVAVISTPLRPIEGRLLDGGGLSLTIPYPPRTKKNGTTLGIKQTPAYRAYRDFIITLMKPLLERLQLPLPAVEYNLCALYYIDLKAKRADLVGLHQGLMDALENAEVICNDWWFRTTDGSRVIPDDPSPRVELTITPLRPSPPAA